VNAILGSQVSEPFDDANQPLASSRLASTKIKGSPDPGNEPAPSYLPRRGRIFLSLGYHLVQSENFWAFPFRQ